MTIETKRVGDHDWETLRETVFGAFGDDTDVDPDGERRMRALVERAWLAVDSDLAGQCVGGAATFDFEIHVPGGTMAMAGLTMVGVRATHRKRGVLPALMHEHLADARAKGYALSGLWATEATIYGRYGFGYAAECDHVKVATADLGEVAIPHGATADPMVQLSEAAAREALPSIYARAFADRPGALVRTPTWWHERRYLESPHSRNGASKRRYVVARRNGSEDVGYLVYRNKSQPDFGGALSIIELVATDPRAEASLWRYALSMRLFPTVTWHHAPVDTLVPFLVADHRKIERTREETLWLHVLDVPSALAARRYVAPPAAPVDIALVDEPDAIYRFDGTGAPRVSDRGAADVTLTRAALGSIFLGGTRAHTLARAGAIAGDARAIAELDRSFAWPVPPWIPEVF